LIHCWQTSVLERKRKREKKHRVEGQQHPLVFDESLRQ
jgi:hypothetical protein